MKNKKALGLVLAVVLLVGVVAGGTVAWLTAQTREVTNVFKTSDIGVELKEHTYDAAADKLNEGDANLTDSGVENYKMVPGWTIPKDPWAKVTAGSEDCYLFIKVEEEITVTGDYDFDDFIAYNINSGADAWIELDAANHPGVYYRVIDTAAEKGVEYPILAAGTHTVGTDSYTWAANQILVKPEVTKAMMNAVTAAPKLKFTAYAVQLQKSNDSAFTAAEAWAKVASN